MRAHKSSASGAVWRASPPGARASLPASVRRHADRLPLHLGGELHSLTVFAASPLKAGGDARAPGLTARRFGLAAAVVLDDGVENLFERDRRLEADERADLRDVGHAARHVLEALLVRLVVRDAHDLALRARQPANLLGELVDAHLLVRADVADLAHGLVP